jgi:hypothetical protein
LIVIVVEEEYREDAVETVVSGLVLGCLLALPDHHPFVVVCSDIVRTFSARQQGRAKPWHPVDAGLEVARRVATRLSKQNSATGNQTLPTAKSVRNLGQLPRVLGLQAILDGGRNRLLSRHETRESLPSLSTVMSS